MTSDLTDDLVRARDTVEEGLVAARLEGRLAPRECIEALAALDRQVRAALRVVRAEGDRFLIAALSIDLAVTLSPRRSGTSRAS